MMTLKFYTDKHIKKSIVEQLRQNGVDVLRCEDIAMDEATDEEHLSYATTQKRIVLTCDTDFLILNQIWAETKRWHAGIAFLTAAICNNSNIVIPVLSFWHEAVLEGAAGIEEFQNQVNYVK